MLGPVVVELIGGGCHRCDSVFERRGGLKRGRERSARLFAVCDAGCVPSRSRGRRGLAGRKVTRFRAERRLMF